MYNLEEEHKKIESRLMDENNHLRRELEAFDLVGRNLLAVKKTHFVQEFFEQIEDLKSRFFGVYHSPHCGGFVHAAGTIITKPRCGLQDMKTWIVAYRARATIRLQDLMLCKDWPEICCNAATALLQVRLG